MMRKVVRVLGRTMLATTLAVVIMLLPLPTGTPAWLANMRVPVVMFFLVCYIGKLLYDTLFYDHYWP